MKRSMLYLTGNGGPSEMFIWTIEEPPHGYKSYQQLIDDAKRNLAVRQNLKTHLEMRMPVDFIDEVRR